MKAFLFSAWEQRIDEWSFENLNSAGVVHLCFGLLSRMSRQDSCISSVLVRSHTLIGTYGQDLNVLPFSPTHLHSPGTIFSQAISVV